MNSKSYTIFMEYRIRSESWEQFQTYAFRITESMKKISPKLQHKILVSEAEPRQIVEVISTDQPELISQIRNLRKEKNNFLIDLDSHIDGGRSKIKFWVFRSF